MDESMQVLKPILVCVVFSMALCMFLLLAVSNSASGDSSVMAGVFFRKPFIENTPFHTTSPFGDRLDPFGNETISHHNGIDLSAPAGSIIIASADGEVVETGYEVGGLGNYVYLKHDFDGLIYFSAYGHMLDNSISVVAGQQVMAGDKLGIIGSSGNTTGIHLHFMIMTPVLSYEEQYLVDPYYAINGLR